MNKYIVFIGFMLLPHFTQAALTPASVKGLYHLGTPERGKSAVQIEFGTLGNKTVLAVACQGCPPAVYTYLKEESATTGVEIFTTAGLYVLQYDDESFVIIQPDAQLGRQAWSKIGHANIYSKNPNKAKSVSRADIEKFATDISHKIMNQEVGEMTHLGGTYFLAMPVKHSGKPQSEYEVSFIEEGKKRIIFKPCERCSEQEYHHLGKESAIAGVDVYRHLTSHYLFDLKDGVLLTAFANAGGLGKDLWSKHHYYNVLSNNKAYIRQILASKEKQDTIDQLMSGYFKSIKTAFEEEAEEARKANVATRELPTPGLIDNDQQALALAAAKRWAKAWNWKENIESAHFSGSDWAITRNKLTGVITGKVIRGFVTMSHPDGRCRFQYVSFRQDFDGSNYVNFQMSGVGPVYDLTCDKIN